MNWNLLTLVVQFLVAGTCVAQMQFDIPPLPIPEHWRNESGDVVVPSNTVVSLLADESMKDPWIVGGDGRENVELFLDDGWAEAIEVYQGGEFTLVEGFVRRLYGREPRINILGGEVASFRPRDATYISVSGGTVPALRADVMEVSGGDVGTIAVFGEQSLMVSGGHVGVVSGSDSPLDIQLSGGFVEDFLNRNGSQANNWMHQRVRVSGGEVGIYPRFGGVVEISGGHLPDPYFGWDAVVTLIGDEFKIDGVDAREIGSVEGNDIILPQEVPLSGGLPVFSSGRTVLSGVLADGTPFSYSRWTSPLNQVILKYVDVPEAPSPETIVLTDNSLSAVPVRGLNLIANDGAVVPEKYDVINGRFELNGGRVGFGLDVLNSELLIEDGVIEDGGGNGPTQVINSSAVVRGGEAGGFQIRSSNTVVTGGTIRGNQLEIYEGETWISGGEFRSSPTFRGGRAVISGGQVRRFGTVVLSGGEHVVSGGGIARRVSARADAKVNVHVLSMDDESPSIDGLGVGESLILNLEERSSINGILSDGSPFRVEIPPRDSAEITLIKSSRMGDFNNDDTWTVEDADLLCSAISEGNPETIFDLTMDGVLDMIDMERFLSLGDWRPGEQSQWPLADTNLDQRVNVRDFLNLSRSFGQTEATWSNGDADCNGEVNVQDFLTLSRMFNGGQAAVSVPEPAHARFLFAILVIAVARIRSRCTRELRV